MAEFSVALGSVTDPMDCVLLLIMSYNAFLIADIGLLDVHFKMRLEANELSEVS